MKKKDFEVVFDVVRAVIHQWDPYGLLALGCPLDEFDSEIQAVAKQIDRIGSSDDAIHVISRVFSSYFEPEKFCVENCRAVGEQLYHAFQGRGVLPNFGDAILPPTDLQEKAR